MSYIYIGQDLEKPNRSKVGKTHRSPKKRVSETTNPHYMLYHDHKVHYDDLDEIEKKCHRELVKRGHTRILHAATNKPSEWFKCSPEIADEIVSEVIINTASKREKERKKQEKIAQERKKLEQLKLAQAQLEKYKREQLISLEKQYADTLKALETFDQKYNKDLEEYRASLKDRYSTESFSPSFFLALFFLVITRLIPSALVSVLISELFSLDFENVFYLTLTLFLIYSLIKEPIPIFEKSLDEKAIEIQLTNWMKKNREAYQRDNIRKWGSFKKLLNDANSIKEVDYIIDNFSWPNPIKSLILMRPREDEKVNDFEPRYRGKKEVDTASNRKKTSRAFFGSSLFWFLIFTLVVKGLSELAK